MTSHDGSDEDFLEELRALVRRTEVAPPSVVATAESAFRWRSVATAIASLEFDSAVDGDDQLARVRSAGAERRLRFARPGAVVEVALMDGSRGLAGKLDPPVAGSMVLRHPDGTTLRTPVDEEGRFYFAVTRRGPVSLKPAPNDTTMADFQTEWVTI